MNDLFLIKNHVVHHKASETDVIIINSEWFNGEVLYNCLVPQKDEKGKVIFCNASYSQKELII